MRFEGTLGQHLMHKYFNVKWKILIFCDESPFYVGELTNRTL